MASVKAAPYPIMRSRERRAIRLSMLAPGSKPIAPRPNVWNRDAKYLGANSTTSPMEPRTACLLKPVILLATSAMRPRSPEALISARLRPLANSSASRSSAQPNLRASPNDPKARLEASAILVTPGIFSNCLNKPPPRKNSVILPPTRNSSPAHSTAVSLPCLVAQWS